MSDQINNIMSEGFSYFCSATASIAGGGESRRVLTDDELLEEEDNKCSEEKEISTATKRSSAWKHFILKMKKNEKSKQMVEVAICTICQAEFIMDKTGSTGHLKRHLNGSHRLVIEEENLEAARKNPKLLSFFKPDTTASQGIKKDFPADYVKWISASYLPLDICESKQFNFESHVFIPAIIKANSESSSFGCFLILKDYI